MKFDESWRGHADQLFGSQTFSQRGEDLAICSLLELLEIPISEAAYLDLGANHPIASNNTYLLYRHGARGVCVEPDQSLRSRYASVRPEDKFLGHAVHASPGLSSFELDAKETTFFVFGNGSGRNTCDIQIAEEFKTTYHSQYSKQLVASLPIEWVLDQHFGLKAPVFVDIDIEGYDAQVMLALRSFYMRRSIPGPEIICVEIKDVPGGQSRKDILTALLVEFDFGVRSVFSYSVAGYFGDNVLFVRSDLRASLEKGRGRV